MAAQWTTNRQYTLPEGATGADLTPSGVAWTPSSWVLLGTPDADSVLFGVTARTASQVSMFFIIEIGIGDGSPSTTVVDNFFGWFHGQSAGAQGTYGCDLPRVIGTDRLTSGTQVWARVSHSDTNTTHWFVKARYLKKPIIGNLLVSSVVPKYLLAAGPSLFTLNSGSPGAIVQLTASIAADIVIEALHLYVSSNGVSNECELLRGASGSEVRCGLFPASNRGLVHGPMRVPLYTPIDIIRSGDRISARARRSTAGMRFGFEYREKPL